MVFPPAMGQLAGENYWQALIGFILTDAGIALLGIIAVVLVGNEITDLGNLISKNSPFFFLLLFICSLAHYLHFQGQEVYRMN